MRIIRYITILFLFALAGATPRGASSQIVNQQDALIEWEALNNEANELTLDRYFDEAIAAANKSIGIAEKFFGAEHPNMGGSLNVLANIHRAQGQYPQAELLFNRSLAITEKAHTPGHEALVPPLENLAGLYRMTNRREEAEVFSRRAAMIRGGGR